MHDEGLVPANEAPGKPSVGEVRLLHRILIAVVVGSCLGFAYLAINSLSSHFNHAVNVVTAWDRSIPFVAEWVWVYNLNIPMPLFLIIYARQADQLQELVAGYLVIFVFAGLCFLLLPVQADQLRAVLPADSTDPSIALVGFYYWFDGVGNCLPSLHVAYSIYAGCWGLVIMPRRLALPYWALGVLISLSTMFVKQHFIADVVLGIAAAVVVYQLQFRRGVVMRLWLPQWVRRVIRNG